MYKPLVELPLFYGDEREDVLEFIDSYRLAGIFNGRDEEKLALGRPIFLKKHSSLWFKPLSGPDNLTFEVLCQKRIAYFDSSAESMTVNY